MARKPRPSYKHILQLEAEIATMRGEIQAMSKFVAEKDAALFQLRLLNLRQKGQMADLLAQNAQLLAENVKLQEQIMFFQMQPEKILENLEISPVPGPDSVVK